jgi:hypothetical protein
MVWRNFRNRRWNRIGLVSGLAVTSTLVLLAGCGELGPDDPTKVETALEYIDNYGNVSSDGSQVWASPYTGPDSWSRVTPQGGADITHTSSPAVCGEITTPGQVSERLAIFSVDGQSHFRTIELSEAGVPQFSTSWGSYGQKAFASKPTCAMREFENAPNNPSASGFVLAGRSSGANDHYLYASRGIFAAPGTNSPPAPSEAFARVDTNNNDKYDVNGFPALATDGVNAVGQNLAMVFMGDDNRTVYAHVHSLPYTTHSWSARITGPVLPSGWTAAGTPSIDFAVGWAYFFHIVVRAVSGSQSAIYETYFAPNGTGSGSFIDSTGGPYPFWKQLPVTGTISSDPAVIYSPNLAYYQQTLNAETLFFTSGTQIEQTNGFCTSTSFGQLPVLAIQLTGITSVSSSPAAVPDPGLERNSVAAVVARHSNQLFYIESSNVGNLIP